LPPTLPGDVPLQEIVCEITVISALRNTVQSKNGIRIDTRHLNIFDEITSPLTHGTLISALRRWQLLEWNPVDSVPYRNPDQVRKCIRRANNRGVVGIGQCLVNTETQ